MSVSSEVIVMVQVILLGATPTLRTTRQVRLLASAPFRFEYKPEGFCDTYRSCSTCSFHKTA